MKRKNLESRRHKALRRCGTALSLLVILVLLGDYALTPGMSRRQLERELGTGELTVLWQDARWTGTVLHVAQIAGNERAMVSADYLLHPLRGWQYLRYNTDTLDSSGGGEVHIAADDAYYAGEPGFFYGRVSSRTDSLRIRGFSGQKDPAAGEIIWREQGCVTVGRGDFREKEGLRWFKVPAPEDWTQERVVAEALDSAGAVLGRQEIGLWPETGLVMDDLR